MFIYRIVLRTLVGLLLVYGVVSAVEPISDGQSASWPYAELMGQAVQEVLQEASSGTEERVPVPSTATETAPSSLASPNVSPPPGAQNHAPQGAVTIVPISNQETFYDRKALKPVPVWHRRARPPC